MIDLQRANRALGRLADMLRADPAMADRAARWMRGDLTGGSHMPTPGKRAIRLPDELMNRADRLVPLLQRDPELLAIGARVSTSLVLRLAIVRGLDALEREYDEFSPLHLTPDRKPRPKPR